MSDTSIECRQATCTRGDKCILIHIAVTIFVVLILVIVYVAHIWIVPHEGWDAVRITRKKLEQSPIIGTMDTRVEMPNYSSIGVAYIRSTPQRLVCNTILVKQQWSLAPAHCVTIRSNPELAQYLPLWKLKYKDYQSKETDVNRGVVHSYFNKDDFDNNIGLFEHMGDIQIPELKFPEKSVSELYNENPESLLIVGWKKLDEISSIPVRVLHYSKCVQFVTPIVDAVRKTELCVTQTGAGKSTIEGGHGGAVILNSQIVGFFSWGERSGSVPQVILAIEPYRIWVENMIALSA